MKTRWKTQEGKEEKVSGRKREEEKGRERGSYFRVQFLQNGVEIEDLTKAICGSY